MVVEKVLRGFVVENFSRGSVENVGYSIAIFLSIFFKGLTLREVSANDAILSLI